MLQVTVYFNFDRTDDGFTRNTWHDEVLCVVLSHVETVATDGGMWPVSTMSTAFYDG